MTPAPTRQTTAERQPALPTCDHVPIRGFGAVWANHPEVAHTLGCPGWPPGEQATDAAVQPFERGLMLWLAADSHDRADPVYVLFDDGSYQRFPDLGPADPAVVEEIPERFYAPGDRFGAVYWEGTGARVRERLGHATGPQVESAGALQQFWNGRMLWIDALDRIFVLYEYWEQRDDRSIRIRRWQAFEDTFGE